MKSVQVLVNELAEADRQLQELLIRRQKLLVGIAPFSEKLKLHRDALLECLPPDAARHYTASNGAIVTVESVRPPFTGEKKMRILRIFQDGKIA